MGTLRLSGPLPSKLGNLTKLKELLIDRSGVSGDIPSTFANLKNLETLRISDLSNGRSSLTFIRNIKSLTIL
ncbi:hypothetical protein Patl1_21100 [Pistacia atlantica]|uniref:Uncharacterized protein n=1 Tax=Pistacia atlantica TaxID=434234 RepID=A0ACC1BLC6_9ROSI|nr:hypothetical protein Patl1_21100 [Pistacia atlantica]